MKVKNIVEKIYNFFDDYTEEEQDKYIRNALHVFFSIFDEREEINDSEKIKKSIMATIRRFDL